MENTNVNKKYRPVIDRICRECGKSFLVRRREQEYYSSHGYNLPQYCRECYKIRKEKERAKEEELQNELWRQKKEEDRKEFGRKLESWNVADLQDIRLREKVLYIIGNGFDLLHGVHSSYYDFRDSLGRNSSLRQALDSVLTGDDIWSDFEEALAHFDMGMMVDESIVDMWLDALGAYDEDASAADFFAAAEFAANPMMTIADELLRRFRHWVERLTLGTDDRPLKDLFHNSEVLCFNYTEFVEELYGVLKENVCYIHGCRRKEKRYEKEELILGHRKGASDGSYEVRKNYAVSKKNKWEEHLLNSAVDNVFRIVSEIDEGLTKDSSTIIRKHDTFFDRISETEDIVVIGHSFSEVDWEYFSTVYSRNKNRKNIKWYMGCFDLRNLDSLQRMIDSMRIDKDKVTVFRTDTIHVDYFPEKEKEKHKEPKEKKLCDSEDGKWSACVKGKTLRITEQKTGENELEILFSGFISRALFIPSELCFIAIMYGVVPGIFLFRFVDEKWKFIDELEAPEYQHIINKRLRAVYYDMHELIYIYNNRIRKYSLETGKLIWNQQERNAGRMIYAGVNVSKYFIR